MLINGGMPATWDTLPIDFPRLKPIPSIPYRSDILIVRLIVSLVLALHLPLTPLVLSMSRRLLELNRLQSALNLCVVALSREV